MVTGTVGLDVVTAALTAGADDVLYKPIDLAILAATVSKCSREASIGAPERLSHQTAFGASALSAPHRSNASSSAGFESGLVR